MRYRRLDADYDMCFGAQQADFLRDSPEAVAQAVLTRLRLWVGEWFLDTSAGTPWQQAGLGVGKSRTVEPMVRARILDTEGVTGIESMSMDFEPNSRTAMIDATITTAYGQARIQEAL